MTVMVELLLVLAALGLILCSGAAVTAWRRERQRARQLAQRLLVEGRIEQLTVQTLQTMRQAAREHLRNQR